MMNYRNRRVWMRMSDEYNQYIHYISHYIDISVLFALLCREREFLKGISEGRAHVCMRDSYGTCGANSSRVGAKGRKAKKKLKGTMSM